MQYDPHVLTVPQCFGLVAKNSGKTMEMCKTKATNEIINLKRGGYPASTPLDALLLVLVGVGVDCPVFLCIQQSIGRRARAVQMNP